MKKEIMKLANNTKFLVGCSVVTGIGALVAGCIETPRYLEARKRKKEDGGLTKKDEVVLFVKHYGAVIALETISVATNIVPEKIHADKYAAVIGETVVSEAALRTFERHTEKIVGKETMKEVRQSIAQEEVDNDGNTPEVPKDIPYGNGYYWFKESTTGQWMICDLPSVENRLNHLNNDLNCYGYVSKNTYLSCLGFDTVDGGDYVGLNSEYGILDITETISEFKLDGGEIGFLIKPLQNFKENYSYCYNG